MSSSIYTHHAYHGWSILLHRDIQPEEVHRLISPDGRICADNSLFRQMESSDSARVFESVMSCIEQETKVYIKHYLNRSIADFLKHCLRRSRGKRAFDASLMLRENSFFAPEPLVLMQKKKSFLPSQSILITKKALGDVQLARKLLQLSRENTKESLRRKRAIISGFGSVVGRMHAKGIIHGDLRLGNVLVEERDKGFSFWFIDNESTRQFSRAPQRLVRRNLVQINKYGKENNSERMSFLKAYCSERGMRINDLKHLLDRVEERTSAWRIKKGRTFV